MQLSSYSSGSGIGGSARSVEYPMRSSFSIISSLRDIVQKEGTILALFRGNVAATYLWAGYSMVQFSVYGRLQHVITSGIASWSNGDTNSDGTRTMIAFLSGASAGTCATLCTYPFDLCRTTFAARGLVEWTTIPQTAENNIKADMSKVIPPAKQPTSGLQPPKSLVGFATDIYRSRGIRGFYGGAVPAVLQIIPYMGLNFSIYEYLTNRDRNIATSGYAGSIAGATSKVLVYPMDTVKKRLQAQSVFGNLPSASVSSAQTSVASPITNDLGQSQYSGMRDCIRTMYRVEGASSFYRGIVPAVLKNTIATGLSFAIFRATKNSLEAISVEP